MDCDSSDGDFDRGYNIAGSRGGAPLARGDSAIRVRSANRLEYPYSGGDLACDLLLIDRRGRWVRPGSIPHPLVARNTCRKLLKIVRLKMFQFDSKLTFFWHVQGLAKIGNTLGHVKHGRVMRRDTRTAPGASNKIKDDRQRRKFGAT